jgi:hypothetical protein
MKNVGKISLAAELISGIIRAKEKPGVLNGS